MGEKTALPYNQGKMLTYDAAVILEAIAADLRQRTLTISGGTGSERIDVPANAKLEIAFKQKIRPEKNKQNLSIEISWKEVPIAEVPPAPTEDTATDKPTPEAEDPCDVVESAVSLEETTPNPDAA